MRLFTWIREHSPTPEMLRRNKWLRPFADTLGDPNVWHFNRHSVARGVALGLFLGFAIPIGQIFLAALLAVSVRANIAVAALFTFVSNPLTTPFIYLGALETGNWLLQAEATGQRLAAMSADNWAAVLWDITKDAPIPVLVGLFFFAILAAAMGWVFIHFVWRIWTARRWNARQARLARRRSAA